MATKEELFAAIKLLKYNCASYDKCWDGCPLARYCHVIHESPFFNSPCFWHNPEEGGGEDGK